MSEDLIERTVAEKLALAEKELAAARATLHLAQTAVDYALCRIRDDENIRWHMGWGTQAFAYLIEAHCAFYGRTPEEASDLILKAGGKLKRRPAAEVLEPIRSAWDDFKRADGRGHDAEADALDRLIEALREAFNEGGTRA